MSQKTKSTIIERTCDGCGVVKEWEVSNITRETVDDMTKWFTVIHEVWVDGGNRQPSGFDKLLVQACSPECVPVALVKILLPPAPPVDTELDDIDLDSLRQSGPRLVN